MRPNFTIVTPTVEEVRGGVLYTWNYGSCLITAFFVDNEFERIVVFPYMGYPQHVTIKWNDTRITESAVAGILSGIKEVALNALRHSGILH